MLEELIHNWNHPPKFYKMGELSCKTQNAQQNSESKQSENARTTREKELAKSEEN